jgi:MFS family permease
MTDGPSSRIAIRGSEWRTIGILLAIYALAYLDRQILTLLVDPIREDLGVSDVEIGFLQGLGFTLFYALCGPFLGWMVDRYRRRQIVFGGILVWSLCTAASGFADTYHELLIARFGVGAGEAALLPAAYSIISDQVERSRLSRAMAVFSLGAIVGGSLSYVIGGALVTVAQQYEGFAFPVLGMLRDWQMVFLAIGLIGMPMAFLIFAIPEPGRRTERGSAAALAQSDDSHFRRHWRFYACHILGFSLFCFLGAATTAWSATYVLRVHDWSVGGIGALLGMKNLIGGTLGMLGGGILADWLAKRGHRDAHLRMYVFILPVFAGAGILAFTAGNMWLVFAGLTVISIIAPFIAVAAAGLQLATPPDRRGLVSAVFLLVYNIIGFGFGPAVVALISRWMAQDGGNIGLALALSYAVVTPLAIALLALGMKPMRAAVLEVSNRQDAAAA